MYAMCRPDIFLFRGRAHRFCVPVSECINVEYWGHLYSFFCKPTIQSFQALGVFVFAVLEHPCLLLVADSLPGVLLAHTHLPYHSHEISPTLVLGSVYVLQVPLSTVPSLRSVPTYGPVSPATLAPSFKKKQTARNDKMLSQEKQDAVCHSFSPGLGLGSCARQSGYCLSTAVADFTSLCWKSRTCLAD